MQLIHKCLFYFVRYRSSRWCSTANFWLNALTRLVFDSTQCLRLKRQGCLEIDLDTHPFIYDVHVRLVDLCTHTHTANAPFLTVFVCCQHTNKQNILESRPTDILAVSTMNHKMITCHQDNNFKSYLRGTRQISVIFTHAPLSQYHNVHNTTIYCTSLELISFVIQQCLCRWNWRVGAWGCPMWSGCTCMS